MQVTNGDLRLKHMSSIFVLILFYYSLRIGNTKRLPRKPTLLDNIAVSSGVQIT